MGERVCHGWKRRKSSGSRSLVLLIVSGCDRGIRGSECGGMHRTSGHDVVASGWNAGLVGQEVR